MVDSECDQRVLDIVRMFLAASHRGDHAVLVLESRKQQITTKYRSVERKAGAPASTSTTSAKKKMNPARARRSKLRLEQFNKKKEDEKLKKQQTGSQTATGGKLVLEKWPRKTKPSIHSQVCMLNKDILYTLEEIFPRTDVFFMTSFTKTPAELV